MKSLDNKETSQTDSKEQVNINIITSTGIIHLRSPVSFFKGDIKRGGTLNIHAIRGYVIGGVFNKYVVGVRHNGTQKTEAKTKWKS